MASNHWERIESLFHAATEMKGLERANFIGKLCDSEEIKNELILLLKQHDLCAKDTFDSPLNQLRNHTEFDKSSINESDTFKTNRSETNHLDSALRHAAAQLALEAHHSPSESIVVGDQTLISKRLQKLGEHEIRKLVGHLGDKFEFRELLGQGGMGAVVRAYDCQLDREVAIKLIVGKSLTDDARRGIIRESKAVAKVKSDHIIDIYSVSNVDASSGQTPFLVLELVEGLSLSQLIRKRKQLEPKLSAELAKQIGMGLAAAHDNGLIHCDIKPANVLIEQIKDSESVTRWRAKIADFGLARATDTQRGHGQDPQDALPRKVAGTLAYMSLEQLTDPKNADHRSDIYSLGATLYEMLTGEPPFRGSKFRILKEVQLEGVVPPRQLDERLPRDLESICLKALSKDPKHRYQTAMELVEDVTRFQNGQSTHARPLSLLTRCGRWCRRHSTVVVYSGLTAAALVLLAIASLSFALTVAKKDTIIAKQQQATLTERLNFIENAKPAALPLLVEDLKSNPLAKDELQSRFNPQTAARTGANYNLALALSMLGNAKTKFVVDGIADVLPTSDMCINVIEALAAEPDAALRIIATRIDELQSSSRPEDKQYLAQLKIIQLYLDGFHGLEDLARLKSDPDLRTRVIHEFVDWHADLRPLLDRLGTSDSYDWLISQMLGLIDPKTLNHSEAEQVLDGLAKLRTTTTAHASYANATWALTNWGQTFPVQQHVKHAKGRDWESWDIAKGISLDLVRIEPTTIVLGRLQEAVFKNYPQHEVTITRPFLIANSETTVEMYQQFLKDPSLEESELPARLEKWNYDEATSPTLEHPVQKVSWYDAAKFCNWLSRRHQLNPYYRTSDENYQVTGADGKIYKHAVMLFDPDANGFRLPTEAEWEVACRAGAETKYHFGSESGYFPHYGVDSVGHFKSCLPIKSLMPNSYGLFEMHGSVWEWCNDWHHAMDETPLVNPIGPKDPQLTAKQFGRIIRGGGVRNVAGATTCACRGHNWPHVRYSNVGFRVARNVTEADGK